MPQISQNDLVKAIATEVAKLMLPKVKGIVRTVVKEEQQRLYKATNKSMKKIFEQAIKDEALKVLMSERKQSAQKKRRVVEEFDEFDEIDNLQDLAGATERGKSRAREIIEQTYGDDPIADLISDAGEADGTFDAAVEERGVELTELKPLTSGPKVKVEDIVYSDNPVEEFGAAALDPTQIDYSAMMDEMERRGTLVDSSKRYGVDNKGEVGAINPNVIKEASTNEAA